jgi:8-oxo-dGTP pyrophosphatase MutT (NUDIX family)
VITSIVTDEFQPVTTDRHRGALDGLLSDAALPTDRGSTWHVVASVLLATGDGRVLLARNRRGWGTVGGHVEPTDASLRAAVVREALEEVGLLLTEDALVPLSFIADAAPLDNGCAHWDFCFVRVLNDAVPATPASDVSEARWFPLDALPDVNDHMRQHLDAVRLLLDR